MAAKAVDTLARLVAYPTTSDRPTTELAAYVAERMESAGLTVHEFADPSDPGKGNLLGTIGPEGSDGLVISGHMDVVPTAGQPWKTDPFRLTEAGGRLYGRGTTDMKGFVSAVLEALDDLDPAKIKRELVCAWTYDEEVGCLGSARLVTDLTAQRRVLPSACWIGEPTSEQVLRMHPGHVTVSVNVVGRGAHSSRPDLGVNAIEAAAEVVRQVRDLALELRSETRFEELLSQPWVAVNVGRIHGGTAINIVADQCMVELGYRPLPGTPAEEVYERLVARLTRADFGQARVEPQLGQVSPSLLTPEGTPLQLVLAPHAHTPECGAAPFATDGGNLARLGMKPLVFGPGSIDVAHRADEYLEADALLRCVGIAGSVIRARCC